MTKKHFQLVAEALNSLGQQGTNIQSADDAKSYLVGYFCGAFISENPKFDKNKFEKACGFQKK
jgi:hypothetical protein